MTDDIVKKDYEEIIHEGQPARLYPNGVIRSLKGTYLHMPPEIMRERRQRNIVNREEKAKEALMLATQSQSPEEGFMKMIRQQVNLAMSGKGRETTEAAKFVADMTGFRVPEQTVEVQGEVKHSVIPALSPKYLEYLERLANRDVIEGKVIEEK